MPGGGRGRNDPERRQRIVDAALDVIALLGVANTTHRRIAAQAAVPLGSVTYYFVSLEDLLTTAFLKLAQESVIAFGERLEAATDRTMARDAVVEIIAGSVWAKPRTLLLSYELYAFAARNLSVRTVMQRWMESSRAALGRFFDPLTARALDALIEGIGIHNSIDKAPLDREAIRIIVGRIAGGADG